MSGCVFCGSTENLTKEHIFPKWLQRHLGVGKQELKILFYSENPQTMHTTVYDRHLNRNVCRKCNNEWMSRLESEAGQLLKAMLEDKVSRNLTDDEVHSIGLWIFKTALTLHNASPYPQVIPELHYHLAFERKAPARCLISIARLKNRLPQPSWIQDQNWIGAQLHFEDDELREKLSQTYRVVIGFGYFAARVIYFPFNLPLFPLEDGVQVVHPRYPDTPVVWPPSHSVDDLWELNSGVVIAPSLSQLNNEARGLTDNE